MLPMSSSPNSSSSSEPRHNYAGLFDVTCTVEIILGRSTMTVQDCLRLRKHAVIKINEPAGSDMQITVNGVPVARGEVLVVDDTSSIRVTQVLVPSTEMT